MGRGRPLGKAASGGETWGGWYGCGWSWRGRGTWCPPCPLLRLRRPPARRSGLRGPSTAPAACQGPRPGRPGRWRGLPGPRSRLPVHLPRPPLRLRQLPARRPGPALGQTSRAGGAPGAAVRAAARLAGAAVLAPCAPGAPSGGGAAGLAAWAAGAVSSAGAGPRVDGLVSAEPARGCLAGGPTGTAATASRGSSPSARVSPTYPGETGEREPDRRWWRSSCLGEPSESDITVTLVGMRGGRCALPTTSWCICVVPWAVLCSALQGGGWEGRGGRRWR